MALKKIRRSRAPLDGTWFQTKAHLPSVLRDAGAQPGGVGDWSEAIMGASVPLWVCLEPHNGEQTRENPDGVYYHAKSCIGDMQSPEIAGMSPWSAGLFKDSMLDGWDNDNKWIYNVLDGDEPKGEDASVYACDKCNQHLYRDDDGLRYHTSACLYDGELVCRDCDYRGAIITQEMRDRLARCLKLAEFLGPECFRKFQRDVEILSRKESWGRPAQTFWSGDGNWSFFWSERVLMDGVWKSSLCGGLIQHGPTPILDADGGFRFRTWDYTNKVERDATVDEYRRIDWSIHT